MSDTPAPGIGDRWLAGDALPGVAFSPRDAVALARGARAGERATVLVLVAVAPEPVYLVRTARGDELHVRQSALRAAAA